MYRTYVHRGKTKQNSIPGFCKQFSLFVRKNGGFRYLKEHELEGNLFD